MTQKEATQIYKALEKLKQARKELNEYIANAEFSTEFMEVQDVVCNLDSALSTDLMDRALKVSDGK